MKKMLFKTEFNNSSLIIFIVLLSISFNISNGQYQSKKGQPPKREQNYNSNERIDNDFLSTKSKFKKPTDSSKPYSSIESLLINQKPLGKLCNLEFMFIQIICLYFQTGLEISLTILYLNCFALGCFFCWQYLEY